MGLRLQQIDILAINLVRTPEASGAPECVTLSEARDLFLRLKSAGKDRTFVRSAHRNAGYGIKVLGDHPLSAYPTVDAAKFRDWLIDQRMARDTIKKGVWQHQIHHQPSCQRARLKMRKCILWSLHA